MEKLNGNGSTTSTMGGHAAPVVIEDKQATHGQSVGKVLHLTFRLNKHTENTLQYKEVAREGQPKAVGTFYIQKYLVSQPYPELISIQVTIPLGTDAAGRS